MSRVGKQKTLLLTRKEIEGLVDVRQSMKAVERAFCEYGHGRVQMPSKMYLRLDKYNGDFRAMPAHIEGIDRCALKWVNVHPGNAAKGLPSVMATLILSDPKTGFPLCIMDGTYATNLRTGAAGGVAAKYLAGKNSSRVGLVGCGVQAKMQLFALVGSFPIEEIAVWGFKEAHVKKFIKEMKQCGVRCTSAKTVKECVEGSDIVVTSTPSRKPLVKYAWLKEGAHINAIGADAKGKQELDVAILKKAKVVVDSWDQAAHSGEINVAVSRKVLTKKDIYGCIGEICAGKRKGRTSQTEITVFDSTGLAIQDVAIADAIYKEARKKKVGCLIDFI